MDSDGPAAPDPEQARSSAEFVAQMQALKDWSGLTYRELTARADAVGDVLPRSTVANMLSRSTVPREELVAAFVRACGCGPGTAETWLRVRKELSRRERPSAEVPEYAVGEPAPAAGPGTEPGPGPAAGPGPGAEESGPPEPPRRPWLARALLPTVVVALGGVALAVTLASFDSDEREKKQSTEPGSSRPASAQPGSSQPGTLQPGPLRPGPVRIRAVHSGLCLAEEGGQNGQLYQQPCSPDTTPRFSLKGLEPAWRIVTFHRTFGEGCTGVKEKSMEVGAPVEDQECGKRGPAEAFRLEPVGKPVRGYRMRPLHSDLCAGVPEAATQPGAEIRQLTCTKDAKGQLFAFDRETGTP
ncbi:RICIN domain-containing protein [Streptomyces sp. NPDC002870]|uniref:RICIN domain-containing protein n=1 Tax=Streptomyces sp. NPDC002870 TaxID=3364666 RepID=UPI00367BBD96